MSEPAASPRARSRSPRHGLVTVGAIVALSMSTSCYSWQPVTSAEPRQPGEDIRATHAENGELQLEAYRYSHGLTAGLVVGSVGLGSALLLGLLLPIAGADFGSFGAGG